MKYDKRKGKNKVKDKIKNRSKNKFMNDLCSCRQCGRTISALLFILRKEQYEQYQKSLQIKSQAPKAKKLQA